MRTLREIYKTDDVWNALPEDLADAPEEVQEILREMELNSLPDSSSDPAFPARTPCGTRA